MYVVINCIFIIIYTHIHTYKMIHKHNEGYPLYVKGNIKIFDYLKLVLSTTISIPKPISICVQF